MPALEKVKVNPAPHVCQVDAIVVPTGTMVPIQHVPAEMRTGGTRRIDVGDPAQFRIVWPSTAANEPDPEMIAPNASQTLGLPSNVYVYATKIDSLAPYVA